MKRSTTSWMAMVGLVGAIALAWWWQNRAPDAGSAPGAGGDAPRAGARGPGDPVAVEVGRVERMRLVDDAEAVGTVQSIRGVVLRPEVSGRVETIGFAEGQRVKRGQLLVQLDDALQRAQLRQAEAQAGIARTELQRNRELVGQAFVSQSVVDQSAAALEVALAQVALAQAQLSRMRIVAPFDGMAGIRRFELGDYLKDGAELVNIEDSTQVLVDYRLPERHLARIERGLVVDVQIDALPGRRFGGRVEALDSLVDSDGRSLLVRARLDNREGVLKPGMFARVRTTFGVRDGALMVPEEALVPQGGKQYLIKVVESERGLVSQRLEAKLGVRVPGKVEILQGLNAADRVVTAGQARLMRGDALPLRLVQVGPAAGPASAAAGAIVPASSAPGRPAA
ncbi:MAG: efflux RND transporter periplasmic adaptor subunit [Rubrivivax sp.]|nr:efflux RND transporter periplasmic adaptor subunit [Rubrivivax sp.]